MATALQTAPIPAHELIYEPHQLPKLRSNHGPHLRTDTVGWMRETPINTPMDEIRRRFDSEGYIFLKSLLPRKDVLDMRQTYFEHMSPTGILAPNTSPRDGIFNPSANELSHHGVGGRDLPSDQSKIDKLVSAHTHPSYLTFLQHPNLRTFVRDFMHWDRDVLTTRTILRHNVPNGLSTGIHYDKIFLRAGEAEFLTAWVPIGDCSAQGGGLMYLENSTDVGKAMEEAFNSSADAAGMTREEKINGFNVNMARDGQLSHDAVELTGEIERGVYGGAQKKRRWLVGNYEAGDVVFHNPYMIHGACKNEDEQGRIRLSTDLRFYEEGSELDERWMKSVWRPGDGL